MRLRPLAAALPLTLGLTSVACKKEVPPPPPAPAPVAEVKPAAVPQPSTTPPSAVSGKSAPDCITPFPETGEWTEHKIGNRTFRKNGLTLSVVGADDDKTVTVGVLANVKEATPENLLNLKKYSAFFTAEKAEAVLVNGDSGDTGEEIQAVLSAVASSTELPVFVIPGNREPRAEFQTAFAAAATKHTNLVNMTQIRLANLDDVSLLSLPGYYDKRFINAGAEGCQYFKEDVDALGPIATVALSPVLLMSHAEPYGKGKEAIDAFPDGNAGDLYLKDILSKTATIPFGVFANMHEAGGRATDLESNVIKPGEEKERLLLNVGAADATAWTLNDGTTSHGMAATVTVTLNKASYKSFRAPKLTDAELEEAKKLAGVPAAPEAKAPAEKTAETK